MGADSARAVEVAAGLFALSRCMCRLLGAAVAAVAAALFAGAGVPVCLVTADASCFTFTGFGVAAAPLWALVSPPVFARLVAWSGGGS